MPDAKLQGKRIAAVITDGFEQVELTSPRDALRQAGAIVELVSPKTNRAQGWNHFEKGDTFPIDVPIAQAKAENYDGLLLPGGVANPDQLRTDEQVVAFVRAFMEEGKPTAAICHGPWTLIETGMLEGRAVTSARSLRTDLTNAGARWEDREVVVDNGLVTSRGPDDLEAFNAKLIEELGEAAHSGAGNGGWRERD